MKQNIGVKCPHCGKYQTYKLDIMEAHVMTAVAIDYDGNEIKFESTEVTV